MEPQPTIVQHSLRSLLSLSMLFKCSFYALSLLIPFLNVFLCSGSDVGFIMIPGAQIPGELYTPLAQEIQKQMADRYEGGIRGVS